MKIYPEMDKEIIKLLDMEGMPLSIYAARYIEKLQAENAELRERLDKAIEPPVKIGDKKYMPDCDGTMVLEETVIGVRLSYDNICGLCVDCVETRTQRGAVERFTYPQWQTLLYDTREATEARLKEIKEENND